MPRGTVNKRSAIPVSGPPSPQICAQHGQNSPTVAERWPPQGCHHTHEHQDKPLSQHIPAVLEQEHFGDITGQKVLPDMSWNRSYASRWACRWSSHLWGQGQSSEALRWGGCWPHGVSVAHCSWGPTTVLVIGLGSISCIPKSTQLSWTMYYATNKSVSQIKLSMEKEADISTWPVQS